MKSTVAFEEFLPLQTRKITVTTGMRQVMGLAMAMSLLAVALVLLGLFA